MFLNLALSDYFSRHFLHPLLLSACYHLAGMLSLHLSSETAMISLKSVFFLLQLVDSGCKQGAGGVRHAASGVER